MGDSETGDSDSNSPQPHGRRGALQHTSSGGKFAASSRESSRRSSSSSFFRKISSSEVKYHAADEKPKLVKDYIVGKVLGEGSYAKVKEAVNLKTMRRVALKIFNRRSLRRMTGGEAAVQREILVLKPLKHENIVELVEDFVVPETDKLYLALEYMGGGTLQSLLERAPNRRLPPIQARKLFLNMIQGLKYLHSMKIVHRDLKPDNLLLTVTGELKISDFGCAGVAEDSPVRDTKKVSELSPPGGIGSPAYQAPELVSNPLPPGSSPKAVRKSGGHRSSVPSSDDFLIYNADIWSAGIVLYVMITGEFPFPNKNNLLLLFEDIAKGNYVIPSWIQDSMLEDLLKKLLAVDPAKRITINEILDHPWLDKDLPRQTPVPIDPAPSLFGHDSRTVESSAKRLKKQLEQEAKERTDMNGGLEEENENDSDDARSFSRGRMMMTRSIDDLRNRSRATSRNPSKSPPQTRSLSSSREWGLNVADEFSRSSSLSASDSSSGKGREDAPELLTPDSKTPSPKPKHSKRGSQKNPSPHKNDRKGTGTRHESKRHLAQPAGDASPSSTSHSNTTATPDSSSDTNTDSPPPLREIGRSRSQNRKCIIM